jgi:hypothetical protein
MKTLNVILAVPLLILATTLMVWPAEEFFENMI